MLVGAALCGRPLSRYLRRLWFPVVLIIPLLAVVAPAQIPPPELTVSSDRQTATVGDPISFTLTVRYDSTLRLAVPPPSQTLGEFDVLGDTVLGGGVLRDGRREYRRQWRLAAFKTGSLWIPGIVGQLTAPDGAARTWQADSLAITITSVLAGSADTADIRGLKGPFVVAQRAWLWWLLAALVVLLFFGTWWWDRHRRRGASGVVIPPTPPWEEALTALAQLRAQIDPQRDGARLWYFRLSEILRRYWDGRYGWQSIDQTSAEIARRLPEAPFDGTHRQRAREFLELADQVRYARLAARPGRAEIDWEWVRDFVNETIPRLAPMATDGTEAADGGGVAAASAMGGSAGNEARS